MKKRTFSCGKFIVKFMLRNINRINCNDIAKFVLNVYENKIYYLKDYIYDIVTYLPHYNVAKCLQIKIRKMLVSLIHEKEDFQLLKFRRAIFSFSKNSSIDKSSFIKAIKSANLNFYEEELKLELLPKDSKEFSEYIRSSIQLAKGDNARQGLNGIRYSKSICPLQTILNILNFSSSKFDIGLLKDIIQLCLDTLGCLEQDVSTKDDAIKILIFLNRTYKSSKIDWKQIGHELWDNYDAFSKGYEDDMKKYSNYTYGLSYNSLLLCFGFKTSEKISDHILAVSQEDSYGKIKTLSILQYLFENIKTNTVEESVVMNCIQFAINETFSDTRDIKINAVQCLLELLKFNVESNAILNHLSKLMDDSLWSVKRTIIYGIDKIKECNEDYAKIILQKGSLDYNYLVRRAVDVVEGRNE